MIEIIPIMLFLIEWNPDKPGGLEVQRQTGLYASVEACEDAGKQITAQKNAARSEHGDGGGRDRPSYKYSCQKMPEYSEFQNLIEGTK